MRSRNPRTPIIDVARTIFRYRRHQGRWPNLLAPERFTEKMQWRKLFDRDPVYAVLSDKLACRAFIEARLGPGHLAELLWQGDTPDEIPFDRLTQPYVIKCAHGSEMNWFVDDPASVDRQAVRRRLASWQKRNHGRVFVEPGYARLKPRLLVEALLSEADSSLPVEYKFFLFAGRIALVMVRFNLGYHDHVNLFVRADWTTVPVRFDMPICDAPPEAPPPQWEAMKAVAEHLGAGFDHVRVDVLLARERFYVGELTAYSFSGMVPTDPDRFDIELGREWPIQAPARHALAALMGRAKPRPR